MSGYTKGPWEVDSRASTRVRDRFDSTIASAGMASRTIEDAQANAKFIACAPELAEAMLTFVRRCEAGEVKSIKTYAQFTALLKKAGVL